MSTPATVKSSTLKVEDPTANVQPSTKNIPPTSSLNLKPATDIAIAVRNISKMYPLYSDPRDRLRQSLWYALPKFLRGEQSPEFYREFWALQDVSFEVKKGEAVGIIGRNGSGKSTLLQIIAGTLSPSGGEVQVNGRVAALLELGSGFNPEFTGRENVYLNGAIFGFSREEMDARFDEIAAFADIGQFMEQPVKLYSSGMFVRLAFAVQVLLDPDILVVDEALAVGDAYFQHRCMLRMRELRADGKVIVFVTHDVSAVKALCDRAIWIEQGCIKEAGEPEGVVSKYLATLFGHSQRDVPATVLKSEVTDADNGYQPASLLTALPPETEIPNIDRRYGDGRAEILGIGVYDQSGQKTTALTHGQTMTIRITVNAHEVIEWPVVGFTFRDRLGVDLASTNTILEDCTLPPAKAGDKFSVEFVCNLPLLQPGNYAITPAVAEGLSTETAQMCDSIENALSIQVISEKTVYSSMRFNTICKFEEN